MPLVFSIGFFLNLQKKKYSDRTSTIKLLNSSPTRAALDFLLQSCIANVTLSLLLCVVLQLLRVVGVLIASLATAVLDTRVPVVCR
jgi:hypothetical protein